MQDILPTLTSTSAALTIAGTRAEAVDLLGHAVASARAEVERLEAIHATFAAAGLLDEGPLSIGAQLASARDVLASAERVYSNAVQA